VPLPEGHAAATVFVPRRLGRRERWMIASVLAVVLAGVIVLAISLGSSARKSGNGCVDVTIAGPIGGEELRRCGAQARSLCTSVGHPGGITGAPGKDVARECAKVGLPVG
jgi:hypothetical protein